MQPRVLQRLRVAGEQDTVGGQRQVANAWLRREAAHEDGEIATQQRLAAGQANLVDAFVEEQLDQRLDLLELQQIVFRQPDVVLLRHAVRAAEVAAVRDRQAEISQRALEDVACHRTESRVRSGGRYGVAVRCPSKRVPQMPGILPLQRGQVPSACRR